MSFIVQHIVDNHGQRRGTLYAEAADPGQVGFQVGWAMCNKKDVFTKKTGVGLARTRAHKYEERQPKKAIPEFIQKALPAFLERCDKYFQGMNRPEWVLPEDEDAGMVLEAATG